MQDTVWIATIAGIALGVGVILIALYLKKQSSDTAVAYNYDEQNRLTSIIPIGKNTQFVKLKPAGE